GAGYLEPSGYRGVAFYRDVPYAVSADGVITAPATAPVAFVREVLRALGVADDKLDVYVGMHATEHAGTAAAARGVSGLGTISNRAYIECQGHQRSHGRENGERHCHPACRRGRAVSG